VCCVLCPINNAYFESKWAIERALLEDARDPVVLNPGYCIGEMDVKPTSNQIIRDLLRGRRSYINGPVNALDVHDTATGHLLAWEKGRSRERYILGCVNTDFTALLKIVTDIAEIPPARWALPAAPLRPIAWLSEIRAKWFTHKPPKFPLVGLDLISHTQHMDSAKAVRELGFPQNPIEPAIKRTINWFREQRKNSEKPSVDRELLKKK